MFRYLTPKFWMRVGCFTIVAVVMFLSPDLKRPKNTEPFIDTVQTEEAAPVAYSPASGLTYQLETDLNQYIAELNSTPAAQDWKFLHEEWFALSRQWFERLFAEPALYNRYVELWLQKRRDTHEWRISCRREFFPDMNDRELFDKIDWLRQQDEWTEMQTKINNGLARIEASYDSSLKELIGENYQALVGLHGIFMREHLPDGLNGQFFL